MPGNLRKLGIFQTTPLPESQKNPQIPCQNSLRHVLESFSCVIDHGPWGCSGVMPTVALCISWREAQGLVTRGQGNRFPGFSLCERLPAEIATLQCGMRPNVFQTRCTYLRKFLVGKSAMVRVPSWTSITDEEPRGTNIIWELLARSASITVAVERRKWVRRRGGRLKRRRWLQ